MKNVGLATLLSLDSSLFILISSRSSLRSLRLCVHELSRFSGDPEGSAERGELRMEVVSGQVLPATRCHNGG